MANGRPGDHSVTDLMYDRALPSDFRELLRDVVAFAPSFPDGPRRYLDLDHLEWYRRIDEWQRGERLEEGRQSLIAVLDNLRSENPPPNS